MASISPLVRSRNDIRSSVVQAWTALVQSSWRADARITDYAVALHEMLIQYDPSWFSGSQNETIQRWMRGVYRSVSNDAFVLRIHSTSNWQAYRFWILGRLAVILKDKNAVEMLRQRLWVYVSETVRTTTGETTDYLFRGSLRYHCYVLAGILQAVLTLQPGLTVRDRSTSASTVLWEEDPVDKWKRLLRPAIAFLEPYRNGTKRHAEFVRSSLAFDRTRPEYGAIFQPSEAASVLRLMDRLEERYDASSS